jgi:tetratricopeptide (TPR) repeat protein
VTPLLSAAMIVRDEAQFIGDCLTSIAGVVDEIVVADTGSSDQTPEIARRFGARVVNHPWREDFAEARNVSLELARGEWILYIDADERLVDTDRATVEALLGNANEVAFRVLLRPMLNATPYREYRLWRNDPRIRFEGIIHERVVPAIHRVALADGRAIGDCDLLLEHEGYDGSQDHKHVRNLPLLRAELPHDPENLFKHHHRARVLKGLGQEDEAATVLTDAAELARRRPGDPLGVLVFVDLVRGCRDRGEDVTELVAEARGRYPSNKLLWWVQAAAHASNGRYFESLELLDQLLAVDVSGLPDEGPAYDERIFGEYAHEARGLCLFRLGRYAEAAEAYGRASAIDPSNLAYRAKRHVALGRVERASEPG